MTSKYFHLNPIADGVYAAVVKPGTGAWGNAGIIDLGGRTVVFDTFATPQAAHDLRLIAEQLTGRSVEIVVNSHRHIDHVGGNQVFEGAEIITTGITRELIAVRIPEFLQYGREHPEVLAQMSEHAKNESDPRKRYEAENAYGEFQAIYAALPEFQVCLPTVAFEGRLSLYGTKRSVELFSPGGGHTPSDTVLWLPDERILFAGDLVQVGFHAMVGEGNFDEWTEILGQLADLTPIRVVSGHGPVADGTSIMAMQDYLAMLSGLVTQGHSREEINIPERFAQWEAPSVFADNVKFLYQYFGVGK